MSTTREIAETLNGRLNDLRRLVEGGYPTPTDRISVIESALLEYGKQERERALGEAEEVAANVSDELAGVEVIHNWHLAKYTQRIKALKGKPE